MMAICPVPPHKFMFLYQHFRDANIEDREPVPRGGKKDREPHTRFLTHSRQHLVGALLLIS